MDLGEFNKKLSLWAYRRNRYIHYKALVEELQVAYVNPRNTSKTSPIGGVLKPIDYELATLPNGYVLSRHHIASWNLAIRGLKILTGDVKLCGLVGALNTSNQMQTQEGMKREARAQKNQSS